MPIAFYVQMPPVNFVARLNALSSSVRLSESLSSSMMSMTEDEVDAARQNQRNPPAFPGRLRIVKPIEGSFTLRVSFRNQGV